MFTWMELRKTTGKIVFTCGIILSLPRRSWSPIVDMSIPSIIILPPDLSTILNRQFDSVDLPAPVRPTMPICNEMTINSLHCTFCNRTGPSALTTNRLRVASVGSNFANRNNLDCYGRCHMTLRISLYPQTPYSLVKLELICVFPLVFSNLVTA